MATHILKTRSSADLLVGNSVAASSAHACAASSAGSNPLPILEAPDPPAVLLPLLLPAPELPLAASPVETDDPVPVFGSPPAAASACDEESSDVPLLRKVLVMCSRMDVGLSGNAVLLRIALMFMKPCRTQPAIKPRSWIHGHHQIGSP